MRLAFVVDPLDHLKAHKDSSIAMMRAARERGHAVHALEARDLFVLEAASGRAPAPSTSRTTTTPGTT